MENGAVQIYYGEGHGKTNVAIGSAISAACEGKEAIIIQFLKGKNEQEFLSRLEPEVKFFNFSRAGILFEQLDEDSRQEEIMNIKNGFNYARKVVSTGAGTVVILDEILGVLDLHLITRDELADLLASKPDDICHGQLHCTGGHERKPKAFQEAI